MCRAFPAATGGGFLKKIGSRNRERHILSRDWPGLLS
jgi:hypothetical protein